MAFILLLSSNLFITVFKRNKINCYCQFKFQRIRAFEITSDAFKVWLNFIKVLSDSYGFTSITINFILDTIGAIKIACSYWFAIIFSFLLKNVVNIFLKYILTLIDLIILSSDCFAFLVISVSFDLILILDMCWFTKFHGYICPKKTHNFLSIVFRNTHPLL